MILLFFNSEWKRSAPSSMRRGWRSVARSRRTGATRPQWKRCATRPRRSTGRPTRAFQYTNSARATVVVGSAAADSTTLARRTCGPTRATFRALAISSDDINSINLFHGWFTSLASHVYTSPLKLPHTVCLESDLLTHFCFFLFTISANISLRGVFGLWEKQKS